MNRVKPGWNRQNSTIWFRLVDTFEFKTKVAIFELENVLIFSKGKVPFDKFDLQLRQFARRKITALAKQGYSIAIMSNQEYVIKGVFSTSDMQHRYEVVEKMFAEVGVPLFGFFSIANNGFHKPHTWMYRAFVVYANLKIEDILVVGRDKVDIAFAQNIGARYMADAEFFDGVKTPVELKLLFDNDRKQQYEEISKMQIKRSILQPYNMSVGKYLDSRPQSIIIIIGPPKTGKTHLANLIHKETGKTTRIIGPSITKKQLCEITDDLVHGVSLIVDSGHPLQEKRLWIYELAKAMNVPIIYIKIDIPSLLAQHLYHVYIEYTCGTAVAKTIDHKTFNKRYQPPNEHIVNQYTSVTIINYPIIVPLCKEYYYTYVL